MLDKKIKLSIIVPVYNVEDYLERCIISLLKQDMNENEYEIILVDDGSTDSSGEICDRWASNHSCIRVIHTKNSGVANARNVGIEASKGQYLAYVDSDDYVKIGAFKKVLSFLDETEADVCYFGNFDVLPGGEQKQLAEIPKKLEYLGQETNEFMKNIIAPNPESASFTFAGMGPWSGVTRKKLVDIHSIRFSPDKKLMNEDLIYNLDVCHFSKKIVIIPERLYYYCHNNDNSLTRAYFNNRFEIVKYTYNFLLQKLSEDILNDADIKQRVERLLLSNIIFCLKQEYMYNKDSRQTIKKMCNDTTIRDILKNYPIYRMPINQKLLFIAMKYRNYIIIMLLLRLRINKECGEVIDNS